MCGDEGQQGDRLEISIDVQAGDDGGLDSGDSHHHRAHWPQAVGQQTFPGTAKEPAASLESALELSLEQLLPPHPGFTVATEPRLPGRRDPEDPGPREM